MPGRIALGVPFDPDEIGGKRISEKQRGLFSFLQRL